jgi:hypothetical protein
MDMPLRISARVSAYELIRISKGEECKMTCSLEGEIGMDW